jgi:hypothetical protein
VREGVEHPPHHTHFLQREKFSGLDFGVSEKPLETPLFICTYEFRKTELDFGDMSEEFRRAGGGGGGRRLQGVSGLEVIIKKFHFSLVISVQSWYKELGG